jgi:hypothetical protein
MRGSAELLLPGTGNAQAPLPPEGLRTAGGSPHLSMTTRSVVDGARASMLAPLAPLHRSASGPPPRAGEER